MKKLIISATFVLASFGVIAQNAIEVISKWQKMNVPGMQIKVDGNAKTAISTLKDQLKSEKVKAKASSAKLEAEAVTFYRVSPNMINIYATAEENKDNTTLLTVFLAQGQDASTFMSAANNAEAVGKLKTFLENDYAKAQNKEALLLNIKEQEKIAKKGESTAKSLESKIQDLNQKLSETKNQLANQKTENERNLQLLNDLKAKN